MNRKKIRKAVETSAIVWREIVRVDPDEKADLPDSIYALVENERNKCALCTLFFDHGGCDTRCPLYEYGQCGEGSPFAKWDKAIGSYEDDFPREDAVKYAQQIVDILEEWLKSEEKPSYTIESLDKYSYRFIVRFDDKNYDYRRSVDIYTDNINKEEASDYIIEKLSEKFSNVVIEYCATQEQDKACEALVDEWLEEI